MCHATPDYFEVDLVGREEEDDFLPISPEGFAERIKNSKTYNGGDIRLISCQAGAKDDGAAQRVAELLGVNVMAPTETVFVNEDGEIFITNSDILADMWYNGDKVEETGKWRLFKPKGGKK